MPCGLKRPKHFTTKRDCVPLELPCKQVACAAALNTLCIFAGWLVPAYFALRRCHQHALQHLPAGPPRAAGRHAEYRGSASHIALRGRAAEPAGPIDAPQHSGSSIGSSQGQSSAAPGAALLAGQPHGWLACRHLTVDDAVAWILDKVFLENAPPGLAATAWWILAVLSWMFGCMLAILSS